MSFLLCLLSQILPKLQGWPINKPAHKPARRISNQYSLMSHVTYTADKSLRELADIGFVSEQNFVKLGLYLKKCYDKQLASWEVQILKFMNWICVRKLHRSGLDLLPFFQVLPSSAMVFILSFGNSWSQNERSFGNLLPELDFTKFWRNKKMPVCQDS